MPDVLSSKNLEMYKDASNISLARDAKFNCFAPFMRTVCFLMICLYKIQFNFEFIEGSQSLA